ncbi:MAG: high-affinity nickel-transport family protein [Polyangiaceae bacterium]
MWVVILMGLVLGAKHATDADHVVAVSTLVSRERSLRAAVPLGVFWGLGHTLTLLAFGGAIVLAGITISPRVGLSLELAVGVMLVALGVAAVVNWRRSSPPHEEHVEPRSTEQNTSEPRMWLRLARSAFVGVVHGLAGSAAAALLVLGAIRDPRWAMVYLGVFGLGTIVGMAAVTIAMAVPLRFGLRRARFMNLSAALLSVGFGLFLIVDIGFVEGLFVSASPTWTPE